MTATAHALIDSWIAEDAAFAARRAALHLVPAATAPALRFLWNGIKGADGKLQGARYSFSPDFAGYVPPAGGVVMPARAAHITIYHNSHCGHFGADVDAAFDVRNETDTQADYFVCDRMTVEQSHPLWSAVAAAAIAAAEHDARHADKMAARRPGRQNGDGYRAQAAQIRALLPSSIH